MQLRAIGRKLSCTTLTFGFLLCGASAARADFTDTFDNNTNAGGWVFTTNPLRLNQIEPTGGKPGAWFHGTANQGAPSVQTPVDDFTGAPLIDSPFVGDYASRGVTHLSVDAQTINGENDRRGFSIALYDWAGGDFDNAIQAFESNSPIPKPDGGWRSFNFDVRSSASRIPSGWTVLRGDGQPATGADWATLMHEVDQVQFVWGEFRFAYPLHTVWDMGIDNVAISGRPGATRLAGDVDSIGIDRGGLTLVPEPTLAHLAAACVGGLLLRRNRRIALQHSEAQSFAR